MRLELLPGTALRQDHQDVTETLLACSLARENPLPVELRFAVRNEAGTIYLRGMAETISEAVATLIAMQRLGYRDEMDDARRSNAFFAVFARDAAPTEPAVEQG